MNLNYNTTDSRNLINRLGVILLLIGFSFPFFSQKKTEYKVYFNSDEASISPSEKMRLLQFTDSISSSYVFQGIAIIGSCDDVGSNAYNDSLSLYRAYEVSSVLKNIEVKNKETVRAKGEVALDKTSTFSIKEQRKQNRSVEIQFLVELKKAEVKEIAKKDEIVKTKTEIKKPIKTFDQPLQKGDKITLPGILFVGGKDYFLPESLRWLDSLTTALKEHPKYIVQIEGHIYNPGNKPLPFHRNNQSLSECRAERVMLYLIEHGIKKKRLSFVGYEGRFPSGRQPKYDRRVEIKILDF